MRNEAVPDTRGQSLFARIWSVPDPILAEAAAQGELQLARIRVIVVVLLLLTPIYRIIVAPQVDEYFTGFAVNAFALLVAIAFLIYIRRAPFRRWISFATASLDVTLVTIALISFVLVGPPHAGANSRVTFDIYFIALLGVCVRYDRRICVLAGILAIVEYLGVVWLDAATWGLNNPALAPFPQYGEFNWVDVFARIILLASATLICWEIVGRAQQLSASSVRDRLTGLSNRAYFDTRAPGEVSRARRYKQELAIAIVDVDRFKRFNDLFGHETGDRVLCEIARVLEASFRESDLVSRYGGEEFVVLLPQTDFAQAVRKIEELRSAVAGTELFEADEWRHHLTVSAGVASYPRDADTYEELLKTADRRLLRAKREGRNRVVAAG